MKLSCDFGWSEADSFGCGIVKVRFDASDPVEKQKANDLMALIVKFKDDNLCEVCQGRELEVPEFKQVAQRQPPASSV